jgi:hypothetical protein
MSTLLKKEQKKNEILCSGETVLTEKYQVPSTSDATPCASVVGGKLITQMDFKQRQLGAANRKR